MDINNKVVTCDGCGACCRNIGKPPFLQHELNSLPEELLQEVESTKENAEPCIWLNLITGECINYEHRPFVCRDFKVGSVSCLAYRHHHQIDH